MVDEAKGDDEDDEPSPELVAGVQLAYTRRKQPQRKVYFTTASNSLLSDLQIQDINKFQFHIIIVHTGHRNHGILEAEKLWK